MLLSGQGAYQDSKKPPARSVEVTLRNQPRQGAFLGPEAQAKSAHHNTGSLQAKLLGQGMCH